jgi:hypothetical protein
MYGSILPKTIDMSTRTLSPARIRVLFLIHSSSSIASLISYLGRRGCEVWTVNSLPEAMARIANQKPDVIFISLNTKGINHKATAQILSAQSKTTCVFFNESSSRRLDSILSGMDVPFKTYPPNTGPKIFAVIDFVVRNQGSRPDGKPTNHHEVRNWLPRGVSVTDAKDIPAEGRWIQLDDDGNTPPPHTYKLVLPRGSKSKINSYYQGTKLPSFSRVRQMWQASTPNGVFYQDRKLEGHVLSERDARAAQNPPPTFTIANDPPKAKGEYQFKVEDSPSEERKLSLFDRLLGRREARAEGPDRNSDSASAITAPRPDVRASRRPTSLFEKCLYESLARIASPPTTTTISRPPGWPNQYSVILIKSISSEGYLITPMGTEEVHEYTAFSEMYDCLRDKMDNHGEALEDVSPPLLFRADPFEFMPWAEASSHFLLTAQINGFEFSCVFLRAPLTKILIKEKSANMTAIPRESLAANVPLTFELYLGLPKNEKYLLYCRPNTALTPRSVARFEQFGVQSLFIRTQEIKSYYAYCAAVALHKESKVA